jgi:hypothetical protein
MVDGASMATGMGVEIAAGPLAIRADVEDSPSRRLWEAGGGVELSVMIVRLVKRRPGQIDP